MEIPQECFDPSLGVTEIKALMRPSYLSEEQIRITAGSDDGMEKLRAELILETLLDIDAETVYMLNSMREEVDG